MVRYCSCLLKASAYETLVSHVCAGHGPSLPEAVPIVVCPDRVSTIKAHVHMRDV
jgi:hypothetical protein